MLVPPFAGQFVCEESWMGHAGNVRPLGSALHVVGHTASASFDSASPAGCPAALRAGAGYRDERIVSVRSGVKWPSLKR